LSTPVLIAILILGILIVIGNTMIAVAFLRGRKGNFRDLELRDGKSMDELHERVQALKDRDK
jgi:hypothetical protein